MYINLDVCTCIRNNPDAHTHLSVTAVRRCGAHTRVHACNHSYNDATMQRCNHACNRAHTHGSQCMCAPLRISICRRSYRYNCRPIRPERIYRLRATYFYILACTYIYTYIYIYTFTCTYIYMYIYIYIFRYIIYRSEDRVSIGYSRARA
jgi:hypothetical protein